MLYVENRAFFRIYPSRKIPVYDVGQNFQMLLPFLYQYQCPTINQKLYRVYVRKDSHSRRPLSKKEEADKFKQFERLIDEITEICRIKDRAVLLRIALWKARRRRYLAQKYHFFVNFTVYNLGDQIFILEIVDNQALLQRPQSTAVCKNMRKSVAAAGAATVPVPFSKETKCGHLHQQRRHLILGRDAAGRFADIAGIFPVQIDIDPRISSIRFLLP